MLEQQGNALTFLAFYTESKVGKTGLTVTLDVYEGTSEIVTAGSATEIGDGLYYYTLASGSVDANANYVAVFKTATSTVDQQHIPALWVVGRAWVNNIDAATTSRLAPTTAGRTLDVTATGAAGIDWSNVENPTSTNVMSGTKVDLIDNALDGDSLAPGAVTEIAAGVVSGGMSNPITYTYTVYEADAVTPLSDVTVWVSTDSAGTSVVASGTTDNFGEVEFQLDAGTYYVWRQKAGWNFSNPDTEVVS